MPRLSAALLPNTPPRALPLPTHITTTRRSRHQPLPCRCTPLQPAVLTDETDAADLATQAFPLVEPNALQSQDHSPPSSAGGASTPATSDLATVNIATLAKFLLPTLGTRHVLLTPHQLPPQPHHHACMLQRWLNFVVVTHTTTYPICATAPYPICATVECTIVPSSAHASPHKHHTHFFQQFGSLAQFSPSSTPP